MFVYLSHALELLQPSKAACQRPTLTLLLLLGALPPATASTATVALKATVTSPTCKVSGSGAASGVGSGINVDFGELTVFDLRPGDEWVSTHGKVFNLVVTCEGQMAGYTLAKAAFDARAGSGLDPDDSRLLRLGPESTAKGVAVGVWPNGKLAPLDLSVPSGLSGTLESSAGVTVATIPLAALYSRTSTFASAGSAQAALPFTLSYE